MSRILLALLMIGAGVAHFVWPSVYLVAMPPWLPAHRELIALSGALEIAGGAGLLIERTRRAAAWGLILLFVAVFPANVHLALNPPPGLALAMWLRLPLQIPLIWWAWRFTRPLSVP